MKNYTITVNGQVYVVQVEEGITAAAQGAPVVTIPAAPVFQQAVAPAPAPVVAPAAAPVAASAPAAAPSGAAGSITVESPMPGKILSVEKKVGDSVEAGQTIMILEAMKMENEIVAPEAGTIASINVSVNQSVEAGEVLATLN
nr:biotin/lipoyl-containing protein [uncultured Stomatobaculum sp.]